MSDFSDVRDGIKTVLEAHNSKLRVHIYPPDSGIQEKPALVLEHDDLDYDLTLGANNVRMTLHGTLYYYTQQSAQGFAELDDYRSPTGTKSIKAGIETDVTLDSKADFARVVSSEDVQRNRNDGGPWEFSVQFTFDIIKSIA